MDVFYEQLVEKVPSGKDNAKKFGIYALALILAIVAIFLTMSTVFASLGLLVAAGIGWGAYYLGTNQFVEYEYAITNGEIDIDKIVGKRKRSRLLTVEVSQFTAFGQYLNETKNGDDLTIVLASENVGVNDWFADFETESYGNTRLIFTPDKKFLECIRPYLKNGLRLDI
jgi:hypothetical protein